MSPIRRGIERRYPRLGFISAGHQVEGKKGVHPQRSDTIVVHAERPGLLEPFQTAYGGEITESPTSTERRERWFCVTGTKELPVVVPSADLDRVLSNWYEAWRSSGLARRCDGVECVLWRKDPQGKEKVGEISDELRPCICDAEGLEGDERCQPTVRLNVLPSEVWSRIPDIGVWTIRSTGINTNAELASDLDLIVSMLEKLGPQVPLLLRLEQVDSRHGLVPKFRLGLAESPERTMELAAQGRVMELPTHDAPAELEEPVGTYVKESEEPQEGEVVDAEAAEGDAGGNPDPDTRDGSGSHDAGRASAETEPVDAEEGATACEGESGAAPTQAALDDVPPEPVYVGPLEVYELSEDELPEATGERPGSGQWAAVRRVGDRLEVTEGGLRKAYEIRYRGRALGDAEKPFLLDFGKWLKEQEAKWKAARA